MIEWYLHPEPDTKNPSEDREDPEGFFRYPPPRVDRFEFVDPHNYVGEEIQDEEIVPDKQRLSFKTKNGI